MSDTLVRSEAIDTLDVEKAWHIFSILLSIDHPASLEEIGLRCKLFSAPPDLIQYLCSIPGSPLRLEENGVVMVSMVAVSAMEYYVSRMEIGCEYLRRGIGVFEGNRFWDSDVITYFRKRRRSVLDEVAIPSAKRKLYPPSTNDKKSGDLSLPITFVKGSVCNTNVMTRHLSTVDNLSTAKVGIECSKKDEVPGPVSPVQHGHFKDETDLNDSASKKCNRASQILKVNSFNFDLNVEPLCHPTDSYLCEEFSFDANELKNKEVCNSVYLDRNIDSCNSSVPEEKSKDVTTMEVVIVKEDLEERATIGNEQPQISSLLLEPSSYQKQPAKSSNKFDSKSKGLPEEIFSLESLNHRGSLSSQKQHDQDKSVQELIPKQHKLKYSKKDTFAKEVFLNSASISPMKDLENKELPQFESYVIEEEEGSGGYGTVYRARRKSDGRMFAIKCPHANAHRYNVTNELKMLERFGGRNFIIKYEGSFSNGSNECFVLEHVDHDRPEILKKEIDIHQLQWYSYCLFRALAYLHKQGVIHRDVKPGNFLFSRIANQGYLIDFNLAVDLQKKYSITSKSRSNYTSFDHVPLPNFKYDSSIKSKKSVLGISGGVNQRAGVKSVQTQEHDKNAKKRIQHIRPLRKYPDHSSTIYKSQGADGSGITSIKDVTSARTPSIDRMREPLPCQGRKELISLVQNAMRNPNDVAIKSPTSQRKRIAAPPAKAGGKIFYPSPMPLRCTGVPVAGSGSLKSKGDGKHKREGSCAGTKGFRAPEVLIRSLHQGPKIDVWSAGVTLLYLIAGRTPFTGDPEQNIRDIAKLRGSEDLWELAKLHDRESSFPVELLEIQNLSGVDLESWVKRHTRRPELVNVIPKSLFDLIDKCLAVNPRQRISSEEALRHEFLTSCHESLRKQKMVQTRPNLDSSNQHV